MGICASVSHICQATMGSQRLGTYPVEAKLRVSMCHSSWYICTAVTFRQYLMQFSKLSLLASKTPKCLKLLLLKWRWNIIWNQIYIQKVACFWEQLNIWYYPLENDWIIGPEWDHTNMSLLPALVRAPQQTSTDNKSGITSRKCGLRGRPWRIRVPFGTGPVSWERCLGWLYQPEIYTFFTL